MATFQGFEHVVPRRSPVPRAARRANAQLTAILEALLDVRPRRAALDFEEFALVDGLLFGRTAGEADFRFYLGPRAALLETIDSLVNSRTLAPRERAYLLDKVAQIPDISANVAHDDDLG